MKKFALVFSLVFTFVLAQAQETTGITITVSIDNITSDEGKAVVALHTADTFMKGPGIQNSESEITDGKVSFTFEGVTPGTYAIIAMHDANENNRMDFEENGVPKESWGMSGNEMTMGPPTFEAAKFDVSAENLEFNIRF